MNKNNPTPAHGATQTLRGHPWLAHYPAHVPHKAPKVAGGLPQLVQQAVALYPWRPYVVFAGRSLDYAEILARAETFAAALQKLNLPPHSRIALCLPNCPAYVVGFWGTLLAGHCVVNLNPLLTAQELAYELKDSEAALLITFNLNPTFGRIEQAVRLSGVPRIWLVELADDMPDLIGLAYRLLNIAQRQRHLPYTGNHKWTWLEDMLLAAKPFKPVPLRSNNLAVLQYTGGTTGTPKAAMLTHGSLLANTRQVQSWLGTPLPQGEVLVAVLPLFHVFALTAVLLMGTALQAKLVLMPKFVLSDLLKLIRRHKPTLLPGVPSLFQALATHPKAARTDLRSLRFCISGGAPLPAATHKAFVARTGAALVEGYGLTEASPVVACGPSVGSAPAGSVGYPLPGTVIEIHTQAKPHAKLPVGEIGEIWVKGPQVMQGYWRNPRATKAVFHNGWLRTGDMGMLDEHGALHVVDRIKDMIIVNGYKVYPRQVEEVVMQHPAVKEVVVVGVPHSRKGEAPMAFVTLQTPEKPTVGAEALREWANARLSGFAKLAALEVREVLPKTLVGKLSRKELAAEMRAKASASR